MNRLCGACVSLLTLVSIGGRLVQRAAIWGKTYEVRLRCVVPKSEGLGASVYGMVGDTRNVRRTR